jgi:hypothetical protein
MDTFQCSVKLESMDAQLSHARAIVTGRSNRTKRARLDPHLR